jgi:hypothetical protein
MSVIKLYIPDFVNVSTALKILELTNEGMKEGDTCKKEIELAIQDFKQFQNCLIIFGLDNV